MSKKRFGYLNPEVSESDTSSAAQADPTPPKATKASQTRRKATSPAKAAKVNTTDTSQPAVAADTLPSDALPNNALSSDALSSDAKNATKTTSEVSDLARKPEASAAEAADARKDTPETSADPVPATEALHSLPWGQGRMQQARAQLNVRVPAALKRQAMAKATLEGRNLNDVIEALLLEYLQD